MGTEPTNPGLISSGLKTPEPTKHDLNAAQSYTYQLQRQAGDMVPIRVDVDTEALITKPAMWLHRNSFCKAGGSDGKESTCNAGDGGSFPGSGRSPGEGNGSLLEYSCLENSMERGAWQDTVHGVSKSHTQLSD